MKTNKNAFRISSIILSLIMIIVAIPTFGVMAEDTNEPPEYYFWDNVEYKDVTDPNYIKTGDTLKYNRTNSGNGAGFTLVNPDNRSTNYKLSANTTYRLSFKYKVTAITEGSRISIFAARFSKARVQAGKIQFYSMLTGSTKSLNSTTVPGNKTTEVRLIDDVMNDFTNYTVVFTTPSDLNISGYLYNDLVIIIQGSGSAEIDDVEIAEITDDIKISENYVALSDDFSGVSASGTTDFFDSGNVYMLNGVAKDVGYVKDYEKNKRVAKLNDVSGNNGFYFTSDYALEAGATYTMRFKYFVSNITKGATFYANPSVYFAKGKDIHINGNANLFTGLGQSNLQASTAEARGLGIAVTKATDKFEVCEITFKAPSSFYTDGRGERKYLTISTMVVGGGTATVCFDDFEIAKVTGSTVYYPNLNGSEYTNTPNFTGVTVKRSLVMTDAVVYPSELSGYENADMTNFKFTGWYGDAAFTTATSNANTACYAAWDIAKDYTVTRDFAASPYEYKTDLSCDVSSAKGSNMSNVNGKLKFETAENEAVERYYLIRDNGYKNFKLYSDSVYKIELCYDLMGNSEITLGWAARFHANLAHNPTTLLSTIDGQTLTDSSPASGKLVYYISTAKFSPYSNWQVGQYVDSLSLTVKGKGSISFSSISVTALATEPITNEFTFAGENVTYVVPNMPGIVTRYALTLAGDGSSISVHTGGTWQVDALGLTVNNKVLYDTSDTAGKVYNTALKNGDKIAINGFNKGNCVNAANFAVVAAQTVDYPDTDTGIRFRIRSYNYNNGNSATVAYNSKEYTVVRYGIKVGESYVKDDIVKANALKAEGTDISLAEANAYHSTNSFTDYTLAVKDVDEERYIYAVGYMVLNDINNPENNITVYSKNVLVNSYNDLQKGTLGSIITVSQK